MLTLIWVNTEARIWNGIRNKVPTAHPVLSKHGMVPTRTVRYRREAGGTVYGKQPVL
jgi:hypothetical protein